jgi:CheY-like chemotaxis protein
MTNPLAPVMIADDNVALAMIVAERFQGHGIPSILCHNGIEAWRQLQATTVSVIVSDFDMPGIKGTELCRRVHEVQPSLPFILVTAREMELQADPTLQQLNLTRIMPKPFRFIELLSCVRHSMQAF